MRIYLLIALVAAAITYLTTPLVRRVALRVGAITPIRDRDVHEQPVPRMGGVAMLLGLTVAIAVASQVPFFKGVFLETNEAWAIVSSATIVCALGVADDIWDLKWWSKLGGQVLAAALMAWQGVQLVTLPLFGLTIISARASLLITIVVVVVAINAVNFVDGLDGLAAGIVAIAGSAFFAYAYYLTRTEDPGDYSSLAALTIAALVGVCLGFLPHNLSPAHIFMGDSGAMLLGLVVAGSTITITGRMDPEMLSTREALPMFLPIALPICVLAIPLIDLVMAVYRRVKAGQSPFHADQGHLHHRLMRRGHSPRIAVAIMYLWTAIFAFGAASLVMFDTIQVVVGLSIAVVVGLALTWIPLHRALDRRAQGRKVRNAA